MSIAKRLSAPCLLALLLLIGAATTARAQCSVAYTFTGDAPGRRVGASVSGAGDVDADGFDDVVVAEAGTRRVYVYSGRTGATLHMLSGFGLGSCFGGQVSGAGDVDQDGFDDVVVAACTLSYVFSGQDGSVLYELLSECGGPSGGTVSRAGDVNNDGFDDVIVGSVSVIPPGEFGGDDIVESSCLRVYSGQEGALLHELDTQWVDLWGVPILSGTGAGDVDRDGFDDLLIGKSGVVGPSTSWLDVWEAFVLSGSDGDTLLVFSGDSLDGSTVKLATAAGDVDGDGYPDVILGAPYNDTNGADAGRVYVYSGQTGSLLFSLNGEAAGDEFGQSVSGAGDIDNDGYADLIVGAIHNDAGGYNAGRAYVYSGQTGTLLYTFTGEAADDLFGLSVAGAGDINADGLADLIVGAPYAGSTNGGRAYVFTCGPPLIPTLTEWGMILLGLLLLGALGWHARRLRAAVTTVT